MPSRRKKPQRKKQSGGHNLIQRHPEAHRAERLFPKKYGNYEAAMANQISPKGVLEFSWAGQKVTLKFRKHLGQGVWIYEFRNYLAVATREGKVIREIPRKSLPKVKWQAGRKQ
jgi:hypothetical protein